MKVALVGNQNSGKTTLFNALTGLNQKIGNFPGVTVEKKIGIIKNNNIEVIDLPGVYSLFPYSSEEKITRDYLLNEDIDLIINVIDASLIERSLYLTTQLMDLNIPMLIVINMIDLLDKKGIVVDNELMSKMLNIKVIKVSSIKNIGISELTKSINDNNLNYNNKIFDYKMESKIEEYSKNINLKYKRFYSIRLLEKDYLEEFIDYRYKYACNIKEKYVFNRENKKSINDKLDSIVLNKWIGIPFFIIIIFFMYFLINITSNKFDYIISKMISTIIYKNNFILTRLRVSKVIISLINDGIITGISVVLKFVPQLIILFFCIAILETSGYMSRIAFMFDCLFKKIGLSGKSLISFFIGSGCSVTGIMSTRTIENKLEKENTIMLTPFIPCSAKLPIISLFASTFFNDKYGFISASFYFLSIMLIIIIAFIFKLIFKNKENDTYISELPEYKVPNIKYVIRDVYEKVLSFIKRVSSTIFISSIVIWFFMSFSFKLEYGVSVNDSILANISKCISWVFYPLFGTNSFEATACIIQGLIAKEQVVSSMAVIAKSNNIFKSASFSFFNKVSAYSFVSFNLFSIPCISAVKTMKKELNNKKIYLALLVQFVVAWFLSFLIYLIGSLIVGVL